MFCNAVHKIGDLCMKNRTSQSCASFHLKMMASSGLDYQTMRNDKKRYINAPG